MTKINLRILLQTRIQRPSTILALLLLLPSLATGEVNHNSIWNTETLFNALATVTSRQSAFIEEKKLDFLDHTLVQKGTLYFTAPDQLIKRITGPREEIYTIKGPNLWIKITGKPEQHLRTDDHPILHAFIESQRAVLAGDLNALEQYYKLELEGVKKKWTLRLLPRDSKLSSRLKLISMQGSGTGLTEMQIIEVGGDITVLTFLPEKAAPVSN